MKFNPLRHNIPILKRLIPSLKKRWAKLISQNGFIIRKSQGAYFLLNYKNFVDRQIAFYDDYEALQLAKFGNALSANGCDLFLDIGANIGYYSILFAKRGLADRVVAFEPDIRNRYQLNANILLNGMSRKIEVVPKAITSSARSVKFIQWSETSTGQSQISQNTGGIDVEGICLNDFVKEKNLRIFIKMDIEGHEIEAVRGMSEVVAANKIFLQVESFPENAQKLGEALTAMGLKYCGSVQHDHYFSNF